MRTRGAARLRAFRGACSAFVGVVFFLEGGCSSTRASRASGDAAASAAAPTSAPAAASPSSPFKEGLSSILSRYDATRTKAWDPSRRFKALFKAEVSPKIGAVGRGWLSVWWDGEGGSLEWRASAPIAGAGRGGFLRTRDGGESAADEKTRLFAARLSAPDVIACILGAPEAPVSPSTPFEENPKGVRLLLDGSKRTLVLDKEGKPIELSFPSREVVNLQPGDGVPRRIEANGPDGRAVLTLESYGPWPAGEEVPPL